MINVDSQAILDAADALDSVDQRGLATVLREIEARRTAAVTFVVGIHKLRRHNKHEYLMSDGSITIMSNKDALISTAAGVKSLALKDARIKELEALLAAK